MKYSSHRRKRVDEANGRRVIRFGGGLLGLLVTALAGPCFAQSIEVKPVNRLDRFELPESVTVGASGSAYVSNVVGKAWADEGNGYLSKLNGPSQIAQRRWRTATTDGQLNAPKGIALTEKALWVTDNRRVVRYPLDGEGAGEVVAIEDAKQLNDLAAHGEAVYVSDSARGTVHRLTRAGVQASVPAPRGINGLTLHGDQLLGVSFATGDVYRLDRAGEVAPKPLGLAKHFTALDGIEVLADGTLIVTDFKGGRVAAIGPDRRAVQTLAELETPADLGIDRQKHLLYVPSLRGNAVHVYNYKLGDNAGEAAKSGPIGPGLGEHSYGEDELFEPIAHLKKPDRGHMTAVMHRGYLAVVAAGDGGGRGEGFAFYDISNPREPKLAAMRNDEACRPLTEAHGWGSARVNGRDIVALVANDGIQIWDWTDIHNTELLSYMKLPPMEGGGYDNTSWWLHYQAPYIYVGGISTGLHIIDASNPAKPKRIKRMPTSETGGFKVAHVFAVGNELVITNVNGPPGIARLDISDPTDPQLLATNDGDFAYATLLNGEILYGIGRREGAWDMSDPLTIRNLDDSRKKLGRGKGGYAMYQDGYLHFGASTAYLKIDVSDPTDWKVVGSFSMNIENSDNDGGNVVGNLAIICDDHGHGTMMAPHQKTPDNTPPEVNMVRPRDGAVHVAGTSPIGLTFTDQIRKHSLDTNSIAVKPAEGSEPIEGTFSYQLGIVNFVPDEPLKEDTTYEVIVPAGGVEDAVGNAIEDRFTSRFTTGAELAAKQQE
jgi:hypothetical protein